MFEPIETFHSCTKAILIVKKVLFQRQRFWRQWHQRLCMVSQIYSDQDIGERFFVFRGFWLVHRMLFSFPDWIEVQCNSTHRVVIQTLFIIILSVVHLFVSLPLSTTVFSAWVSPTKPEQDDFLKKKIIFFAAGSWSRCFSALHTDFSGWSSYYYYYHHQYYHYYYYHYYHYHYYYHY